MLTIDSLGGKNEIQHCGRPSRPSHRFRPRATAMVRQANPVAHPGQPLDVSMFMARALLGMKTMPRQGVGGNRGGGNRVRELRGKGFMPTP
jgi:hypothetical protein